VKELCYQYNVSLKEYCTWGIGGPAKELAVAKSKEELIYLIKQAKESRKRYIVIGKGSNSLFDDR
jgi:UDP-N-acetylmuramate dehydrogenase